MAKKEKDVVSQTFHAMVESADRKFGRVRDLPLYGRAQQNHYFQKVFKAYMRLWKYQQENRSKLVDSGLNRWEIGEIASRIGQLYFNQYMRSSEARFLVEAYVFYEAILERKYFDARGSGKPKVDVGVRFKELRFYARFLLVALIFNKVDMVRLLAERFKGLVDDSMTNFRVKFAELTLDTYRMMQCLEWEPSGSFYQRRPVESVYQKHPVESNENGTVIDHSGAVSGLIDINLAADLTDPTLPPNPRKAVLYRPSVTRLLAVMATICEELPPETIMLIYLSASGNAAHSNLSQAGSSGGSRKSSKDKVVSGVYGEDKSSAPESHCNGKRESSDYYDNYLWLGPRGYGGSNALYPGDIIPFTRRPLFLIIDSDSSHAFKVLHGAERGEPAALLLSPLKPAFKNLSAVDTSHCGSQFTFFLTAPLPAFCQMVGLTSADSDMDFYNDAEEILSIAFSEWEVILCTSKGLDLVWAQVLSDPFLRRLILRFIFCRSVLSFFCPLEDEQYLPICLPHLPNSVSARSEVVQSAVFRLANHLKVADCFQFDDT
ncbi:PREDICTED: protein SCAI homolog isoform X2 [Populus euphratica]|uniref:Protein SCAI homolog isoform X2 n=1 Tax=Populus euphratica TaxID=75702 RepID=A0AAJ6XC69_POPEU|nr:PREDICTED: protein SCAI homolog isoform X2 [Populus euphratica]